ncbi:predicted protein [Sclerotinia sclerotiorum 1980 UF-70]|uniref:Uncharacterized protein n=1 Tax=Sclerotinia sclerotiorum (strain ATCC 18683 / 1980 / Ss-1) TaxID=665079 RepID=A7EKC2_SCLS1|nr:predicted protein [Sclerotinia sclerotiorum 1980 UF-70]EDO03288.1 predicted protein [Sclerotinia sclerotiorum 1980 UF-70]
MPNIEDMINWPRYNIVLSILDEQKGDNSCGYYDVVTSPMKNTLSTLWVTLT